MNDLTQAKKDSDLFSVLNNVDRKKTFKNNYMDYFIKILNSKIYFFKNWL